MLPSKLINKPWGYEEILYENDTLIVLKMLIKKGEETSLHMHLNRDEYFIILRGKGTLLHGKRKVPLKEGKMIHIKKGQVHRWKADENEDLEIIEVTFPPLKDLVRIKDKYNRGRTDETNV
ncbi:MAG: cupin domain-containing protein [Candidatus Methanomethylicaceae archaeon]